MADRQFLPRTLDGAAPITAHEIEAGDPRGRPGDFLVTTVVNGRDTTELWTRERFVDSFIPAESVGAAGGDHEDAQRFGEPLTLAGHDEEAHRRLDELEKRTSDELEAFGLHLMRIEQRLDQASAAGPTSTIANPTPPASGTTGNPTG